MVSGHPKQAQRGSGIKLGDEVGWNSLIRPLISTFVPPKTAKHVSSTYDREYSFPWHLERPNYGYTTFNKLTRWVQKNDLVRIAERLASNDNRLSANSEQLMLAVPCSLLLACYVSSSNNVVDRLDNKFISRSKELIPWIYYMYCTFSWADRNVNKATTLFCFVVATEFKCRARSGAAWSKTVCRWNKHFTHRCRAK